MNIEQAKKIAITSYLNYQGILPIKLTKSSAYYLSPLRKEKQPSFKVDINKNLWFDHGAGIGGGIIDLCKLINATDVKGSLKALSGIGSSVQSFSFHKQKVVGDSLKVNYIQKIQNKALIHYIESRGITIKIAVKYLEEVYFEINNKKYFALGFKNDKGGYELRNKYYKGCTSPKHITTIKGNCSKSINVFEGFFDFLSALCYFRKLIPGNDTIVLNSLSFTDKVIPLIGDYKKVNLFLDNDNAGKRAFNQFKKKYSNTIDRSQEIYANFVDFNDFLIRKTG